ncbi:MAG: hypothetical protein WDN69_37320 [Aliidongia sp.]
MADGPVDMLSWDTERTGPGLLYENFGTIGATVDIMGRWDKSILKTEFAHRDPRRLILIAFGTNEGFEHLPDPAAYQKLFIDRVQGIREAAPAAAVVIIDRPTATGSTGARRARRAACVAQVADDTPSVASTTHQANMKSGRNAVWAAAPLPSQGPRGERQAAAEMGWFYWDWSAAMGGACAMHRWVEADPPLGFDDHVHLRADGYRMGAQQLFAELMAQYDRYRGLRPPHPSSAGLALRNGDAVPDAGFPAVLHRRGRRVLAAARTASKRASCFLVVASYFFYAQWNWRFCFLLFGSSLLSYGAGRAIAGNPNARMRKQILTGGGRTASLRARRVQILRFLRRARPTTSPMSWGCNASCRSSRSSCRSAFPSSPSTASPIWSMSTAAMSGCAGASPTCCSTSPFSLSWLPGRSCAPRISCPS